MVLADTNILSQPISLPIPIYLHQHIGHWYHYFHFGWYVDNNWYFGRYMPIFRLISMYVSRYLLDNYIQSSWYWYQYGWYQYPICQYRSNSNAKMSTTSSFCLNRIWNMWNMCFWYFSNRFILFLYVKESFQNNFSRIQGDLGVLQVSKCSNFPCIFGVFGQILTSFKDPLRERSSIT